ncbi:uncharacterized protein LOC135342867 [Halichondria panicea]|uniref:uncharacterized protein LOC135342867 n=1 Tax=Halichondria panicea TaxID=6063 RepID=UPI00312B66AB
MGFHRIKEGDKALVLNESGRARLVEGPRRVWLSLDEEIEYLPRRVASQDQYLVVKHRDGRKESIQGPAEMFVNRLEVDFIDVKDSVKLDANHMVVVYKQEEGKIERRIVQGPTIFVPNAHEWLHEFKWHGEDRSHPGRFIPGKSQFTQLCHVPSQFYCNVRDVRTNDDTLITVKLMLFYEMVDVETMLNYTHDPIADFINAVQSDIISFASKRSYEEFIQQTHDLNSMDSYSQLNSRAKRIGYNITKVVYRGYEASRSLQATHDEAVHIRTNLRLKTESEEQEQVLQEFKLKREKERTKLKHEMDSKNQDHLQEIERMQQDSTLGQQRLQHDARLKKEMKEVEVRVDVEKAENEQNAKFLAELRDLGVDMTKYLVALQPEFVPEKEIIVGPAAREVTVN